MPVLVLQILFLGLKRRESVVKKLLFATVAVTALAACSEQASTAQGDMSRAEYCLSLSASAGMVMRQAQNLESGKSKDEILSAVNEAPNGKALIPVMTDIVEEAYSRQGFTDYKDRMKAAEIFKNDVHERKRNSNST